MFSNVIGEPLICQYGAECVVLAAGKGEPASVGIWALSADGRSESKGDGTRDAGFGLDPLASAR